MRKTQFGVLSSASFTAVAKPSAIAPMAIIPVAKISPVASPSPILTTPLTPENSPARYTPSTDNPVGAPTQLYQSVAKTPAYQGNLQIPTASIAMPASGGLKGTSGPSPAPSTSPVPVAQPTPAQVSPDQIPPISYGTAPSAPDASQQGYGGYSPAGPAMNDPTPATVAATSPLAVPPAPPISTPGSTSTSTALTKTTATSPTVSVSIWTRILRFFGFSKAPTPPSSPTIHGEEPITTQEQGAVALVRRARAGDQNAMATLDLIGKNARAGNARAKRSYDLCMAYCKAHPVGADMGGEGGSWEDIYDETVTYFPEGSKSDPLMTEAVKLSFGPPLTDDAIIGYASTTFGAEEEIYAFAEGMRHAAPIVGDHGASRQGAIVGIARRLQQARLPGANLGLLDPRLVAEIGT